MIRPSLLFWRRLTQVGVALLMALIPFANLGGIHWLSGNFLAFDFAGLPLGDPLATLQTLASAHDLVWRAALGAGIALVMSLILGAVFCSYACPYGLFSELAHSLTRKSGRVPDKKRPRRQAFALKASLTGVGLLVVAVFGLPPLLNQLSLPALYSRLWQHAALGGFLLPVLALPLLLLVEWLLGERIWCRMICPQSVLLAAMRRLNPWSLRIAFAGKRCSCGKDESLCVAACSLGLDPRRSGELALQCTNCGDCSSACKNRGQALTFVLGAGRDAARIAETQQRRTPESGVAEAEENTNRLDMRSGRI